MTKPVPTYRIKVKVRNRCARATVWRVRGSVARKIGRVSWATDVEDGPVLERQALEHGRPIVNRDLGNLRLLPPPLEPHTYR